MADFKATALAKLALAEAYLAKVSRLQLAGIAFAAGFLVKLIF